MARRTYGEGGWSPAKYHLPFGLREDNDCMVSSPVIPLEPLYSFLQDSTDWGGSKKTHLPKFRHIGQKSNSASCDVTFLSQLESVWNNGFRG